MNSCPVKLNSSELNVSYFDRCSVTHFTYNYRLWIVAKWCIIGPQLTIDLIGNHAQCPRNSMVHFQPPSITPNLGSVTPLLEFWHIIVYTRLHVLWTEQLSGVVIKVRPSQLYNTHHCSLFTAIPQIRGWPKFGFGSGGRMWAVVHILPIFGFGQM